MVSTAEAIEAARLIRSMYTPEILEAGKTIHNMTNWTTVSYFCDQRTSTQGLIAMPPDKSVVMVCFKGSEELTDWKLDAMAYKTRWRLWGDRESTRVHRGFYKAYRGVRLKVLRELSDIRELIYRETGSYPRLVIAGHSLGGAVAHLMAFDLTGVGRQLMQISNTELVTFGSPAVFSSKADHRVQPIYSFTQIQASRFVNAGDPIPMVPHLGYKHFGEAIVPEVKALHPGHDKPHLRWSMDNHNINTYINMLGLSL